MSVPLSELYQIEKHLEQGFMSMLTGTCQRIHQAREVIDIESERVELKAALGEVLEHRHPFQDGTSAFDTWTASIEVTIATNRQQAAQSNTHHALLGAVRERLTLRYIQHNWNHEVVSVTDIRDSGTTDSLKDENDIDITVLSYYLVCNIRPDAWPEL